MRWIRLTVASLIVVAACGTSEEAVTPTEAVTAAAAPSMTTAPAVASTEAADEPAGPVCRGCVEPPDLPQWAVPSSPGNPASEPLKRLTAGTYTTRLLQPTVTFTVPDGWMTSGESVRGLGLATRYNPPRHTGNWIDILNPTEVGLAGLDWDQLVAHLGELRRLPDGASPLEPITAGGITYPAGDVSETEVSGFRARSVTTLGQPDAQADIFPEIHNGFRAKSGDWIRYTLVDVNGDSLLVITSVRRCPPCDLDNPGPVTRDIDVARTSFLPEADAVIDSLIINP